MNSNKEIMYYNGALGAKAIQVCGVAIKSSLTLAKSFFRVETVTCLRELTLKRLVIPTKLP